MANEDVPNEDLTISNKQNEDFIKKHEKKSKKELVPPPDGGWGWVVVAASFLCNMILDGIGYSFGILLEPLMTHYGVGKGVMSMVGSVLAGVILLVGPIAATLVTKFGTRIVCMSGAVIAAVAVFVSTYSPNVPVLMLLYGVIGGLGLGFMYVPSVVAVGYWFEKRRALVSGIAVCGTGVGTFLFAPLVTYLEETVGWQTTIKILGGICLSCVLFGAVMKPVTASKKKGLELDAIDIEEVKDEKEIENEEVAFINGVKQTETDKEELTLLQTYKNLVKNVPFLLIMIGNLPAVMGLYIPYMFLPSMAKERLVGKAGGDESLEKTAAENAALLISFIGIFNTAGRLINGFLADHPKMDPLVMTTVSLAVGAMCPFFMIFCYNFESFIAVSIMFGFSLSAWVAVSSPMLVNLLGLDQLTSAFGILTCVRGLAAFLGPPVGGFAVDATGDYTVAFGISSALIAISAVVHCIAWCARRSMNSTSQTSSEASFQ